MRKAIAHLRWWIAHLVDPKHTIAEGETMASVRYYSTDPEDSDPRSTARPGEW